MSNSMKKRLKAFKKITKKYIEEVCVKSGVEPTCIDTDEFMVFDGEQGKKAVRISFNPYFMNFYGRIEEDYYPTVDDADIIYDSDRPSFPFFGANYKELKRSFKKAVEAYQKDADRVNRLLDGAEFVVDSFAFFKEKLQSEKGVHNLAKVVWLLDEKDYAVFDLDNGKRISDTFESLYLLNVATELFHKFHIDLLEDDCECEFSESCSLKLVREKEEEGAEEEEIMELLELVDKSSVFKKNIALIREKEPGKVKAVNLVNPAEYAIFDVKTSEIVKSNISAETLEVACKIFEESKYLFTSDKNSSEEVGFEELEEIPIKEDKCDEENKETK